MTERIDPELLPCPFCGGKAVMGSPDRHIKRDGWDDDEKAPVAWSGAYLTVSCINICCRAEIEGTFVYDADTQRMSAVMVERWNTRAPVEKKEIP